MELPDINPDYVALQTIMQRVGVEDDPTPTLHVITGKWLHYIFKAYISSWKQNHSNVKRLLGLWEDDELRPHVKNMMNYFMNMPGLVTEIE